MGAVIMIFALAMVSMLRTAVKLSNKVNSGSSTTLGADAVIDKSINILTQGSNWGSGQGISLTPIPGYKGDKVYNDIPNTEYIVQINPGNLTKSPGDQASPLNLTSPPGDAAYERTVTVDMYTLPKGYPTPSVMPTPWNQPGGSAPATYVSHRTVQAVVRRGALNASLLTDGTIQLSGHWQIFWGDVYDYYPVTNCGYPCATTTVLSLPSNQPLGPGYPSFHTMQGCISSSGSCAGCFGGSGGFSGATYCETTDTGASNCQMYPNDPNMPPAPSVDLDSLKQKAQAAYVPGNGQPGAGLNSGETGYFYYTSAYSSGAGTNSVSMGCSGCAGQGVEKNHQYTGTDFGFARGNAQAKNVLTRMAQNLGQSTSSWVGNDDLVFYIDTTDGLPINSTRSNMVNGASGSVDGKFATFRGTLVLLGSWSANGHSGSSSVLMSPPSAAWCPAAFSGTPDVNGFFYVGGDFSCTGSPLYYGSIDVIGSVSGAGTPAIYFRNDFKYNLIQSGTVATTKWQEVKYFPTPLP